MKRYCLAAALCASFSASPSMATYVVDTGTPSVGGTNWSLRPGQSLAGFFTLTSATVVTSVEGFIDPFVEDFRDPFVTIANLSVTIYSDGPVPGPSRGLYSYAFKANPALKTGAWQGVFGKSQLLAAGGYWVGFATDGFSAMRGSAPTPLAKYAFGTDSGGWSESGYLTVGVRIAGTPAVDGAIPEPASWAMMIAGFGMVGGAMRRKKALIVTKVSYA